MSVHLAKDCESAILSRFGMYGILMHNTKIIHSKELQGRLLKNTIKDCLLVLAQHIDRNYQIQNDEKIRKSLLGGISIT